MRGTEERHETRTEDLLHARVKHHESASNLHVRVYQAGDEDGLASTHFPEHPLCPR